MRSLLLTMTVAFVATSCASAQVQALQAQTPNVYPISPILRDWFPQAASPEFTVPGMAPLFFRMTQADLLARVDLDTPTRSNLQPQDHRKSLTYKGCRITYDFWFFGNRLVWVGGKIERGGCTVDFKQELTDIYGLSSGSFRRQSKDGSGEVWYWKGGPTLEISNKPKLPIELKFRDPTFPMVMD